MPRPHSVLHRAFLVEHKPLRQRQHDAPVADVPPLIGLEHFVPHRRVHVRHLVVYHRTFPFGLRATVVDVIALDRKRLEERARVPLHQSARPLTRYRQEVLVGFDACFACRANHADVVPVLVADRARERHVGPRPIQIEFRAVVAELEAATLEACFSGLRHGVEG